MTFKDVNKFLADKVTATRNWSNNIIELSKTAIDRGLLDQLAQAGPKAAPLIAAILDDVHKGNIGAMNKAQEDMRTSLSNAQQAVMASSTNFWVAGQNVGGSFGNGLNASLLSWLQGFSSFGPQVMNAAASYLDARQLLGPLSWLMPLIPPPHRAAGGPVWPGGTFLVGEDEPEILQMDATGHGMVIPTGQKRGGAGARSGGASSGGPGGGPQVIQLVVSGRVLAEVMAPEWRRMTQEQT